MFGELQSQRLGALVVVAALGAGNAASQPAVAAAALTEVACASPALAAAVPADRIGAQTSRSRSS